MRCGNQVVLQALGVFQAVPGLGLQHFAQALVAVVAGPLNPILCWR